MIRIRVAGITKKALEYIAQRDDLPAGQVVDALLERWALEHDGELAQACGITRPKPNRFALTQAVAASDYFPPVVRQLPPEEGLAGQTRLRPQAIRSEREVADIPPSQRPHD